jgi:hypothetical protein
MSKPQPPTPSPGTERRRRILVDVQNAVCRDRQDSYGDAEGNFATIADLWTTYLQATSVLDRDLAIEPQDVAAMCALLKIARAAHNPQHIDNWTDLAGYAVCGGGISLSKQAAT